MKYAILFLIFGIYLIQVSFVFAIAGCLLFWFGVSFIAVGLAYGWLGAKVFGKLPNGKIARSALVLLLPYLLLTWLIWHIQRLVSQEECCNEIIPGIWLGRRAFARELPPNISLIVDLTAEFAEVESAIAHKTYICVPTLDASVPDELVFRSLIKRLVTWQGNVYIHCALGHGRSATVVAAVAIAKKLADNPLQAEAQIKKIRPGVEFSKVQRQLLDRFSRSIMD
ncbi:hypothetical protein [Argonema antarcticum]|uniref:hypothetical protein n=1 Tax=Argonema antarcticum TaxID=2942763 RepID=UPI002011018F|nr:hypothetical protein [Argonema antarcticum]MCL1470425.1 hypothetical protein [Argonema antarcticum A004/B2]